MNVFMVSLPSEEPRMVGSFSFLGIRDASHTKWRALHV